MTRVSARTALGVLCATSVVMIPSNAFGTTAIGIAPSYTRASDVARTWTAEYMSNDHNYSVAEAEEIAQDFDLIAAMPVAFRGEVDDMRVVNPDLHVLSYSNAMFADADTAAGLPESAFAHAV